MKITFVHIGREHLGIEYLSSMLKARGHTTALAYDPGIFGPEDNVLHIPFLEKLFNQRNRVLTAILESKPDLVAFSVYTGNYPWACGIARAIKSSMNIQTVFGGIHATLVPDEVIANDFVDFLVVGEGEQPLVELVDALEKRRTEFTIPNLWYKSSGSVIKNPLGPLMEKLDPLPLPDKELFEKYVNYKDDYVIMASRGCVFSCSYCCESYVNKLYNNKYYRRRGVDSIMEELNVMKKRYGFREVMFNDALFFTDKKWLGGLLARYKKEIGVPFRCFGKINYFDEEIGRLLVDSGCYSIEFGMQTVNEPLKRKVLHRNETNKRALEVFKLCDKLKIRYDVDHMFGLPRETIDDHIAAVRFYRGLKYLNRVKCHNLTYFPNMEILGDAQREGLIDESDINNIKKGVVGDFFHCHSLKNNPCAGVNKSFNILLKILPLLSPAAVSWILAHKRYRALRFIPTFLVIPLQLVVALKSRDYRFIIYFKYYPLRVKRALFG